jgi:hypothetical protein
MSAKTKMRVSAIKYYTTKKRITFDFEGEREKWRKSKGTEKDSLLIRTALAL